jgi:hypothetical protein
MSDVPPTSNPAGPPSDTGERPGLLLRVRAQLSLTKVQAILGLIAALLSIGGALYGYLRPGKPAPTTGELVAIVQDAKSGKPVTEATLELLTPEDALVTTLSMSEGEARRRLREGLYRLRVTHPRYATEERPIQVMAGETAEIRVRLAPRAAAAKPPTTPPSTTSSAERAINQGVESIKKIFR